MSLRSILPFALLSLATMVLGADHQHQQQQQIDLVSAAEGQLVNFGLQCMSPSIGSILMAPDPIAATVKTIDNYCDDDQEKTFQATLDQYHQCSGNDSNAFTETFWDSTMGVMLSCASYFYDLFQDIDVTIEHQDFTADNLPLKRLPDHCADALLGDNPLGNFQRSNMLYPGKEMRCLATLSLNLPDCTLQEWPVPIVGTFLKAFTCLTSKIQQVKVTSCDTELRIINDCLPSSSILDTNHCNDVVRKCTVDRLSKGLTPSVQMALPAPLSAAPLSDVCTDKDKGHLVGAKFDAFRTMCHTKKDLSFWTEKKQIGDTREAESMSNSKVTSLTQEDDESTNQKLKEKIELLERDLVDEKAKYNARLFGIVGGVLISLGIIYYQRNRIQYQTLP